MRQSLRLYIDGQLADCDASSLILMNYTATELDNPSVVRNSYSQTVSLPGTPANDRIFGKYSRQDYRADGSVFSPVVRVPFLIQSELGEPLERGYLRLVSVAYQGTTVHSYSVQLYGGLGGFFYELSYNADGSERTLADMSYKVGQNMRAASAISVPMTAANIRAAWAALGGGTQEGTIHGLVNFAPAYNGKPACKFDTDKGVYPGTDIYNISKSETRDGKTYQPYIAASNNVLVDLGSEVTEWEVQDLRAYLQRAVLRVRGLIESIGSPLNVSGYAFRVDESAAFFTSDAYYTAAWMTLPMFDRDRLTPSAATLADLLANTPSPADVLISYAKVMGLVFRYDPARNTVTLTTRDAFYDAASDTIDLTRRVDRSRAFDVTPYPFGHRFYQFSQETAGEFAAVYAEKYGRAYGSQTIDTGYQFDRETAQMISGSVLKGAADVVETSPWYRVVIGRVDAAGSALDYALKFVLGNDVSWKLYNRVNQSDAIELHGDFRNFTTVNYSAVPGEDFMPKLQLHGTDNETEDGSCVLVMYDGMRALPSTVIGGAERNRVGFIVSDDTPAMNVLNGGVPCWVLQGSYGDNDLQSLPSFRRCLTWRGDVVKSLDFGVAQETQAPETPDPSLTVYANRWQDYTEDRFSQDSRVMHCWCDLAGLQVGQDLLRRFFWYQGAVWILNRIINHSLTTVSPTECEFIKVQDVTAYTEGQR